MPGRRVDSARTASAPAKALRQAGERRSAPARNLKDVGPVAIASGEVLNVLGRSRAEDLGIVVVEPDVELLAAAALRRGALSPQDWVCLALARWDRCTCVTNDGAVRRECKAVGVPVLWGLELLVLTVKAGGLTVQAAAALGRDMSTNNPRYVTPATLQRFLKRIGATR